MNPIFLLLYAAVLTPVLSLRFPRVRTPTPRMRRALAKPAAVGAVVLIACVLVARTLQAANGGSVLLG